MLAIAEKMPETSESKIPIERKNVLDLTADLNQVLIFFV